MPYWVYILAGRMNGTLYTGVTSDIARRIWEHRSGKDSEFANKHRVHLLVYLEPHDDIRLAIQREKTLKEWKRAWKIALIEKDNPEWRDLAEALNR